jgi:hypothetical protein
LTTFLAFHHKELLQMQHHIMSSSLSPPSTRGVPGHFRLILILAVLSGGLVYVLVYVSLLSQVFAQNVSLGSYSPVAENDSSAPAPITLVPTPSSKPNYHILYGLRGNLTGFIEEWEISLKSVLLNSPLDAALDIHLVVDSDARRVILDLLLNAMALRGSYWRNPIRIHMHLVTREQEEKWRTKVQNLAPNSKLNYRVSMGGYYRLFAHELLPKGLGPILYMDNEVVIMTNLNELWQHADPKYIYQIRSCSGFMFMNLDIMFPQFWDLAKKIELKNLSDQYMLKKVKERNLNLNLFGELPPEWDTNLAHEGFQTEPHKMILNRKYVGMMHFNGIRSNSDTYFRPAVFSHCSKSKSCAQNETFHELYRNSWNLVEYYVHLPWGWVKFFGQSLINKPGKGHALTVHDVVGYTDSLTQGI